MRADNLHVERAAIAAAELSLTRCAELFMAVPVVDQGVDLMAYQADPFRVARVQVKGGLAAYLSAHRTMINGSALCAALAVTERD
jgi:hypothetical protein